MAEKNRKLNENQTKFHEIEKKKEEELRDKDLMLKELTERKE